MNISQRLRTCARHTGLDAVIELLNEAADEIDALQARANGQATQAEVTGALRALAQSYVDEDEAQTSSINRLMTLGGQLARAILALRSVQVPMTDREIELIDGMIAVQLDHAQRCDAIGNRVMAEKQKGWDMERVELLRRIRAYGITAQAKKEDA